MQWEQECNLKPYCRSSSDYTTSLVEYPKCDTYCYVAADISEKLKPLIKKFVNDDRVLFPVHPFTRSTDLPWYKKHLKEQKKGIR